MFEIATLLIFAVYGVASIPTVLYSKPLVVEDAPGAPHHPGAANLASPIIQTLRPPLPGTRNNAERIQVELNHHELPGNRNLDEKAIPERILLKSHHD